MHRTMINYLAHSVLSSFIILIIKQTCEFMALSKLGITGIVIVSLMLLTAAKCFIVGTTQGFHKCYHSDVSPDKTLEVRFGFPRRQKQNCKFQLEIIYEPDQNLHSSDEVPQKVSKLYGGEFVCYDMSPRELFVYKHTSQSHEYAGSYKICVTNLQDSNQNEGPNINNTLFELQLAQKFDPAFVSNLIDTPLVGSAELIEMESNINSIKRTLSWCQVHVKEAESIGDRLSKALIETSNVTKNAALIQILFLVAYGIIWLFVFRGMLK